MEKVISFQKNIRYVNTLEFGLNYIYHEAKCHMIINDTPYMFYEGDILLMDAGSAHAISYQEDDLLINIVFKGHQISLKNLEELTNKIVF